MLSQAQESVEAAEDLAQEVRDPLMLHPRQETARVSRLTGRRQGSPGHFPWVVFFCGGYLGRKRGGGAPGGCPALVKAWRWDPAGVRTVSAPW